MRLLGQQTVRRCRLALAAAVGVLASAALLSGAAATAPPVTVQATSVGGGAVPPACYTQLCVSDSEIVAPATLAARAKLVLHLAPTLARADMLNASNPMDPNQPAICAEDPFTAWYDYNLDTNIYAASKTESGAPYGIFAPTKISALAFGAIPLTATITMTQVVQNGAVVPLHTHIDSFYYAPNPPVNPVCAPPQYYIDQVAGYGTNFMGAIKSAVFTVGRANVQISNVRLDGQPIDVGAACHTIRPVDLNMWTNYPDNPMGVATGMPGTSSTFRQVKDASVPGSTDLTIPPFAGCGSSRQNLDTLITNAVSGPGNQIAATLAPFAFWKLPNPANCALPGTPYGCQTPPYPKITPPK